MRTLQPDHSQPSPGAGRGSVTADDGSEEIALVTAQWCRVDNPGRAAALTALLFGQDISQDISDAAERVGS